MMCPIHELRKIYVGMAKVGSLLGTRAKSRFIDQTGQPVAFLLHYTLLILHTPPLLVRVMVITALRRNA
jgi:hypothetical protein